MMRMINITAFLLFCKRFLTHENGNLTLPMLAAFPVLAGVSFLAIDSTKTALEYQNLINAVDTAVLTVAKASAMNQGSTQQKLTEIIKNNLGKNAGKLSGVSLTTNYATEITVKANYKTQSLLGFTRDMSWETKAEKEIIQKRLEIILVMDSSSDSGYRMDGLTFYEHFRNLALQIGDLKKESLRQDLYSPTAQYYELFKHIKIGVVPFGTYVNTGYRMYIDEVHNANIVAQIQGFLAIDGQTPFNSKGSEWIDWSRNNNGNIEWHYGDALYNLWYTHPGGDRNYFGCIYELEPHRDLWMIPPYTVNQNTGGWIYTSKMNQFVPQLRYCSTAAMLKLGFGYSELHNTVHAIHPENGKNVTVGMLWAYRMLDPLPPYHDVAAPFDDPHTRKIVVLMTSGLNRHHVIGAYGRVNIHFDYLHSRNSGYTEASQPHLQALNHWLDKRLLKVCDMLKAKNVEVFIVKTKHYGVGVGDSEYDIRKYLNKCASKPENVYAVRYNGANELVERLEKYAEETKKPIEHIRLVE